MYIRGMLCICIRICRMRLSNHYINSIFGHFHLQADPFGYLSLPQAGDLRDPLPSEISYRYQPWDWYIYLHESLIFIVNVGQYTIDGMGYCVFFFPFDKFRMNS